MTYRFFEISSLPIKFQAASTQRKDEKNFLAIQSMDKEHDASDGSVVRVGLAELESSRFLIDDHRSAGTQLSKEDLIKLVNPSHATFPPDGSDVKEKPVRIEILEPDVKEILSTCALYNLDQVFDLNYCIVHWCSWKTVD